MDQLGTSENVNNSSALNQPGGGINRTRVKDWWKQMGFEEKQEAVDEEMMRVKQLPANSTYATHRLRVLNKILQLLSIQTCHSDCGILVSGNVVDAAIELSELGFPTFNLVVNIKDKLVSVSYVYERKDDQLPLRTTSQDEELELLFAGLSI